MSAQADYLKKYLSVEDTEKTKKRKKKAKSLKHEGIKIEIDDAFAMVKPKSGLSSGSEDDEEDEELKNAAMKKAGGFFASTFADVVDKPEATGGKAKPVTKNGSNTRPRNSDSDVSPPRRSGNRSDSDASPPRRNDRGRGSDESPPRRQRGRNSDESPPRRRQRQNSNESPPRRRQRKNSDESPPRRRQRLDSDESPPRSHRKESPSPSRRHRSGPSHSRRRESNSPPRRHEKRYLPSPQRGRGPDSSPPRRYKPSPTRRSRGDRDHTRNSPQRQRSPRRRRDTSNTPDRSTPRRRQRRDSDSSPPRSNRNKDGESRKRSPDAPPSKEEKAKDKYTGLLTREEMREKTRRDAEAVDKHLEELAESGRGAEAVHRIRAGPDGKKRRITKEDEARNEREAAKQREINEKFSNISKGIAQSEDRAERNKEMERTLQEGFTRHADDEAMNEHLRDQLLGEDDPLNEYFEKKNMKIRMQSELVYPTYRGHFAPNRYQIPPGYRWDGVDRSNGFESKLSNRENEQRAREAMTYRIMAELAE